MNSLIFNVYGSGQAGLSNLIMSVELGVVLSALTDRVLVLQGNKTPVANVVEYDGLVSNAYPSRVTDLIDLGVPWLEADQINLAGVVPKELCDRPAWDCVFYFPPHLATTSGDIVSFAGRRNKFITVKDNLEHVPALSFSGGPENLTLSFYSYFFYLDEPAQLTAFKALESIRPKRELAQFAKHVVADLGAFNTVHIRRGDFKKTIGVTTLDRKPDEVIEALDQHFGRKDRLVILTDEAHDPFFDAIKEAYRDHVFIDHHILKNFRTEFLELPAHDSIALAYLSQLVGAQSDDFIGTMTSTYTSLVQRMRGNNGKSEPFKFLWNELPDVDIELKRGRHAITDNVPLDKGIMVKEQDGPYSWNHYDDRFNPAWMREWPESFLNESRMTERARGREVREMGDQQPDVDFAAARGAYDRKFFISFLDKTVSAGSNIGHIVDSMEALFRSMLSQSADDPVAHLDISDLGDQAELQVDGQVTSANADATKLLRKFYREVVCQFLETHPELVWLHAGCAASSEGAVVLPGSWGRGKSTLVMELAARGWMYLSDDIAPLDPGRIEIIPFPGTPQIRSKSKQELARDNLGSLPKKTASLSGIKIAQGGQPLSMIVFPHYAKSVSATLVPVTPAQAVGSLLENCLSFAKNEDETIHRLCKVVETLPVYKLHFDDAAEAVDLIADSLKISVLSEASG
jgi:hypothetical protein